MNDVAIIGAGQSTFVRFYPGSVRELAFEGERFYDLMRIARRRGDPSYLAEKVAAKFAPPQREQVRQHLLNEDNWYVKLPNTTN